MKKPLIILVLFLILATTIPGLWVPLYCGPTGPLQSKEELLKYRNATASVVLSAEGKPVGKFFIENRTNISYSQIPEYLINALIATEDARFFEHAGVDSRSLLRVLFKTILSNNRRSGGGSTITQQLAKNMYGRKHYALFSIFRNKLKEIFLAYRLEKVFTKEEIVTLYLNTVSFGENVFGIEAASERYFSKRVEKLKIEEAAVLIGILKANTYYNPRLHPENARTRRNIVLKQMEKYKYLSSFEADSLCNLPMIQNYSNIESVGPADYFLVQVKSEASRILQEVLSATGRKWNIEEDGLIITTTLNLPLQNCAVDSFHDHLAIMQKRMREQYQSTSGKRSIAEIAEREMRRYHLTERADEMSMQTIFDWNGSFTDSISVEDSLKLALTMLHAGLLAMDPMTGAVKAWVGGVDFRTQPYDQISARRQLGSVFKPILYSAALEDGMEPCQYLDNDSVTLPGFQDWSPENFDHSYGGKYSLAGALARSMNVPTFCLFLKVGYDKVDSLWIKMGFTFPLDNTPSLALGTAEASIMEVAKAYSSFANGGYKIIPQFILSIKAPDGMVIWQNDLAESEERVLTERSSLLISAILQKAVREGTGASLSSVYGVTAPLAGKTGTTQNYADAWFAAFNPRLVIVSRVGASSPSIHFNSGSNGSGSTLALPLVALTMKRVESNPQLREQLIAPFPDLPPGLEGALDCPDFKEKNIVDRFMDLFENDSIIFNKEVHKIVREKKSLFERIFKK